MFLPCRQCSWQPAGCSSLAFIRRPALGPGARIGGRGQRGWGAQPRGADGVGTGGCEGSDGAGARPSVPLSLPLKPRLHMRNPERFPLPPKRKERFGATRPGHALRLPPLPHSEQPGLEGQVCVQTRCGWFGPSLAQLSPWQLLGLGPGWEPAGSRGAQEGLGKSQRDVPCGMSLPAAKPAPALGVIEMSAEHSHVLSHSIYPQGGAGWGVQDLQSSSGTRETCESIGSPVGTELPCADTEIPQTIPDSRA